MEDYNVIDTQDEDIVVAPSSKKNIATTVLLIIGYIIAGIVIGYLTIIFVDAISSYYDPNQTAAGLGVAIFMVLALYGAGVNIIPTILGIVSLILVNKKSLSTTKRVLSTILTLAPISVPMIYFFVVQLIV
ncbi:MAG: hypothetical protein IKD20_04950 [Clostridia bacterium]|nr:hypothetical protein [Clostridia bacterium]